MSDDLDEIITKESSRATIREFIRNALNSAKRPKAHEIPVLIERDLGIKGVRIVFTPKPDEKGNFPRGVSINFDVKIPGIDE